MNYLFTFLLSISITYILTPLIKKIATLLNVVDKPHERKVHAAPVPRWGGISIYIGVLLSVLLTFSFFKINLSPGVKGIIVGGSFIAIMGIIDDYVGLKAKVKLAGQIVAAVILVAFGLKIDFLTNPLTGGMVYLGSFGYFLTILWVVAITNTINLIDGLDGLAAGICAIASLTFFILSYRGEQVTAGILSVALAGSCIGFLRFNFNPAKIFMGDVGSMFLGFLLSSISIIGAFKSAATIAVIVPVLILGLPIFDTTFAILRRFRNGQSILKADKGHLHHKLLEQGLTQRETVIVLYLISAVLCAIALMISGGR